MINKKLTVLFSIVCTASLLFGCSNQGIKKEHNFSEKEVKQVVEQMNTDLFKNLNPDSKVLQPKKDSELEEMVTDLKSIKAEIDKNKDDESMKKFIEQIKKGFNVKDLKVFYQDKTNVLANVTLTSTTLSNETLNTNLVYDIKISEGKLYITDVVQVVEGSELKNKKDFEKMKEDKAQKTIDNIDKAQSGM